MKGSDIMNHIKGHLTTLTACSLLAITCFTGCSSNDRQLDTVPSNTTMAEAASIWGVDESDLNTYFEMIDMSWDEFIEQINTAQLTLADFKKEVEDANPDGADFADYIQFTLFDTGENAETPDESVYTYLDSDYGSFDVYFRTDDLKGMTFSNIKNSEIITDSESVYNSPFLYAQNFGTDITVLTSFINDAFAEDGYLIGTEMLPVLVLNGNTGKTLPDYAKDNPFFDDGYVWSIGDDDSLNETSACAVVAIHYYKTGVSDIETRDKETIAKDFVLLCSSDFGFIVKADSYKDLVAITNLDIQVRYNKEKGTSNAEEETSNEILSVTESGVESAVETE